ncbi:MAG TPA: hypothetical protein VFR51_03740 [Pyrinomonadaceae bacterium]|nr:hypothetical protein [Pyrinomonadaceae bacterium]
MSAELCVVMRRGLILIVAICFTGPGHSFAQRRQAPLVCKRPVLVALKPQPELSYECGAEANDWDEKILKLPARNTAIKALMSELSAFSDAAWWTADPVDLSVCDFAQKPGALTAEQRRNLLQGGYLFWLFGNDRIRLMLLPDPCYQTEYGGSNAFLLHRNGGKVFVSQALDGYFSRADNSVNVAFARLNTEEIIEVSTGSGGLNPSLTNYYFTIDSRTNQAAPKNLFRDEHGPTNQMSSAMLLEASGAEPLKVVRGNALAPSFVVYVDSEKGRIDDGGRTLSRKILRWNGNVYR